MDMQYTVIESIIKKCLAKGYSINQTKIQKLLYAVYGIYLAKHGEPPFSEKPICMPYGPVFPYALQVLKGFTAFGGELEKFQGADEYSLPADLEKEIDYVIRSIGKASASKLVDWSHRKGSAWSNTKVNTSSDSWGDIIPDNLILNEFKSLI